VDKYYKGLKASEITHEVLNSLEFTTLFIKETLRIDPSVASLIPRKCIENHMIGNLKINKGTNCSFSILG